MIDRDARHLHYDGIHCTLEIERVSERVVLMTIRGSDVGEFGDKPMVALAEWFIDGHAVDLFIDARDVRGASIDVSGDWAVWLLKHKMKLAAVTMLVGSRLVQVTGEFVRKFAELEMMRICTEPKGFEDALRVASALPGQEASRGGA